MRFTRQFGLMVCWLLMSAGTVWGADVARITQIASKVHVDFNQLVKVKKVQLPVAVSQQRAFLLTQPEVREVQQLKGNNLMVRFKDGNELLMFLGENSLGSDIQPTPIQAQKKVLQQVEKLTPIAKVKRPVFRMIPCAPNSRKALIFDCLEDDANMVSPKIWQQVKSDLQALGYTVTTRLNNSANLANAAQIDNGEYGVVMLRGHGGDLGGDFGFLVRPWYTSYPASNSGYTGPFVPVPTTMRRCYSIRLYHYRNIQFHILGRQNISFYDFLPGELPWCRSGCSARHAYLDYQSRRFGVGRLERICFLQLRRQRYRSLFPEDEGTENSWRCG